MEKNPKSFFIGVLIIGLISNIIAYWLAASRASDYSPMNGQDGWVFLLSYPLYAGVFILISCFILIAVYPSKNALNDFLSYLVAVAGAATIMIFVITLLIIYYYNF